jgi:hypothetical protein
MRLDASGKLSVGNNIPIWSGSYGGALFLKGNNATTDRYAQLGIVDSTGSLVDNGLIVDYNGNVGIGTMNPDSPLHVISQEIGTGGNRGIKLSNHNETKEYSIRTGISGAENTTFAIYDETSSANRLVINTNGNVGIGTTSPTKQLDIYNPSQSWDQRASIGLATEAQGTFNAEMYYHRGTSNDTDRGLKFRVHDTLGMVIDSAGRVTMPYQPSFWASCTETNYAKPGTGIIAMGSVQYNRGNHYNASTSTFTAPVTGVYTIWLNVFPTTNSGTDERYAVWVNGSIISYPYILGGGTSHQPTSGGMDLLITAGDSVYIYVQSNLQEIYAGHTGWGMTLLS